MSSQLALGVSEPPASDAVVINARCTLRVEGEQRVVVVSGVPVHHYAANDAVAEGYAMVFLADSGFAQQNQIARAFGCSVRTVRRHQQRYAEGGMSALATRCGWRTGRRRVATGRLRAISKLKARGLGNCEIARRLGVTEKAIRKLTPPSEREAQLVLPLAARETASAGTTQSDDTASAAALAESPATPPQPSVTGEQPVADTQTRVAAPSEEPEQEPVPMSLDVDPDDREHDRMLACFGLLDDAAPVFGNRAAVLGAGVLVAIPFLVNSGIFRISRRLYGEIGPAFYGLRTTLLTLLLMALLRIKGTEGLKERDPAMLGRILGLDRAPELKTVRRKLTRLASHHQAERLGAELARLRVEQRGSLMGFLYVDGHVRAYHGRHKLPKTHIARIRLSLPATTDYWVNDQAGDPLFVVTAEANAGLVKMLPPLLEQVQKLVGDKRITVVFDRGGWSPKLFKKLIVSFDILTYRKGRCRQVSETRFRLRRAKLDGRWVEYRLHDQPVRFLKGKLRLRQVVRLSNDGHQTQVLTSRWDLRDIEIAYRMFERWRQENFFKYMREEFLLDALVDHQVEPDDPTRSVPNPARRPLDKKIRLAKAELTKLEGAYGAAALDNPEAARPTMRGFKIAHGKLANQLRAARKRVAELLAERRALPTRVELRDASDGAVIKLASERKHLTDILRMIAYQAESDLLALLQPHYARAGQEGRTLLHHIFAAAADIEVV